MVVSPIVQHVAQSKRKQNRRILVGINALLLTTLHKPHQLLLLHLIRDELNIVNEPFLVDPLCKRDVKEDRQRHRTHHQHHLRGTPTIQPYLTQEEGNHRVECADSVVLEGRRVQDAPHNEQQRHADAPTAEHPVVLHPTVAHVQKKDYF